MTPDEVLKKMKELGEPISRSTLLRYEKWGLIPEPTRGGKGRGKGRTTDYPRETPAEAYAARYLMHKKYSLKPEQVSKVRDDALEFVNNFFQRHINYLFENYPIEQIVDMYMTYANIDSLWYDWLMARIKVNANIPLDEVIDVVYTGNRDKGIIEEQVWANSKIKNATGKAKNIIQGSIEFFDTETAISFTYTSTSNFMLFAANNFNEK